MIGRFLVDGSTAHMLSMLVADVKDGIVTRRPLELRLKHITAEAEGNVAWGVFEDAPDAKIFDFEAICAGIQHRTDDVAGNNKGIVDGKIVLSVYGTHVPDLTLIDLPGITRVPLQNTDQTDNIEAETRDMATRYAQDERTIILAVIPANADIATSDALQLARRVDPEGLRTIGVVTKIDIMDAGTNAVRMLKGEDVPLKLGFVGVRNRSQADVEAKLSIGRIREIEEQFFSSHTAYSKLPPAMTGTNSLIRRLTEILFGHVMKTLPEIRTEIDSRVREIRAKLKSMGKSIPNDPKGRQRMLFDLLADFTEDFKAGVTGRCDDERDDAEESACGARIRDSLRCVLETEHEEGISEEVSLEEVERAVWRFDGESAPGFPSPAIFRSLLRPHITKLDEPCLACLDEVATIMRALVDEVARKTLCAFPSLAGKVAEVTKDHLREVTEATREKLQNTLDAETGYIFTNDEKFAEENRRVLGVDWFIKKNAAAVASSLARTALATHQEKENARKAAAANDKAKEKSAETVYHEDIRDRVHKYYGVVVRNLRDAVPKMIGRFLVDGSTAHMLSMLVADVRDGDLVSEPYHVLMQRESLEKQLAVLKRASALFDREVLRVSA
eukprot:Polyplicarium_translucidae@DN3402_c1_g1_i15.p1